VARHDDGRDFHRRNVVNLKAGGLGSLGEAQLDWLERDLKRIKSSTPIVLFAHIQLWSIYPE